MNHMPIFNNGELPPLQHLKFCIFCPSTCIIPGEHHHNPKEPNLIDMRFKHD